MPSIRSNHVVYPCHMTEVKCAKIPISSSLFHIVSKKINMS